mgnify:CR=1 FL=1
MQQLDDLSTATAVPRPRFSTMLSAIRARAAGAATMGSRAVSAATSSMGANSLRYMSAVGPRMRLIAARMTTKRVCVRRLLPARLQLPSLTVTASALRSWRPV